MQKSKAEIITATQRSGLSTKNASICKQEDQQTKITTEICQVHYQKLHPYEVD